MTQSEALKKYFYEKGLSQAEIAEKLGCSQQHISMYINGKRPFGLKQAQKWSDAFGFRVNWLRTGEGPMFESAPVQNNTAGGAMIINSPGTTTDSSEGEARVYKDLYEKAQAEIVDLRIKMYKLMDRLTQNGLDCDCD